MFPILKIIIEKIRESKAMYIHAIFIRTKNFFVKKMQKVLTCVGAKDIFANENIDLT